MKKALIIVSIIAIAAIGLNLWQHFGSLDNTKEDTAIQNNKSKIDTVLNQKENIEVLSPDQVQNIDKNLPGTKTISKATKTAKNEKINNYYSINDSLQFIEWSRSAFKFRNYSLHK